jgi:AcrR family transcriptional regulator
MNRRLTTRGKERRRQLMEFAARRFAENGYHPTSVAEIVDGMRVGKGVFYWYFSSKEELFLEILAEAQRALRRRQQQAIQEASEPVQRIELGIRASMDWLSANRHVGSLFQFAASEERFAPYLRRGQDVAIADVVRHVQEGIQAGQVRDADPVMLAHAILGVTNHLARTFLFERDDPAGPVADAAVSFCLEGLLGTRVLA